MDKMEYLLNFWSTEFCYHSRQLVDEGKRFYYEHGNTRGALVTIIEFANIFNNYYQPMTSFYTRQQLKLMEYLPVMQMIDIYDPHLQVVTLMCINVTKHGRTKQRPDAYMKSKLLGIDAYTLVPRYNGDSVGHVTIVQQNMPRCDNQICGNCGTVSTIKLKLCSGCMGVRYCSSICQTRSWKQHKPICKLSKNVKRTAKKMLARK
jgi:hypothetical protein